MIKVNSAEYHHFRNSVSDALVILTRESIGNLGAILEKDAEAIIRSCQTLYILDHCFTPDPTEKRVGKSKFVRLIKNELQRLSNEVHRPSNKH